MNCSVGCMKDMIVKAQERLAEASSLGGHWEMARKAQIEKQDCSAFRKVNGDRRLGRDD